MKEIIIIGLAALLMFFIYEASQSGKNAFDIQPTASIPENVPMRSGKNAFNVQPTASIPENVPTTIVGSLPETRVITGDSYTVAHRHEPAEQDHAPTTWGYWTGTRVIPEGEYSATFHREPPEQYYAVIMEEIIEEEVIP